MPLHRAAIHRARSLWSVLFTSFPWTTIPSESLTRWRKSEYNPNTCKNRYQLPGVWLSQQPPQEPCSGPNTRQLTSPSLQIFNESMTVIWKNTTQNSHDRPEHPKNIPGFDIRTKTPLNIKKGSKIQTGRKKLSALKQQCPFKIYHGIDLGIKTSKVDEGKARSGTYCQVRSWCLLKTSSIWE